MVKSLLIAVNEKLTCDDLGKLLLRLAVGGLMLFHGLHKLFGGVGVLIGEVVAPILIIVGLFTRPAALVLAFTMIVAWLMVGTGKTFALDAVGAWAIESLVYFFIGSLAVAFLGAGRYAVGKGPAWR